VRTSYALIVAEWIKKFPTLIEPRGSFLYSQEPTPFLSYLFKIYFNIILPFMPGSCKRYFPVRFREQNYGLISPGFRGTNPKEEAANSSEMLVPVYTASDLRGLHWVVGNLYRICVDEAEL
jgi:hypothetical protein